MDWMPLFEAAAVAVVVLYAPGIFVVRACHFTWLSSFLLAPSISAFLYIFLGLVLWGAGTAVSGFALFISAFCLSIAIFAISLLLYQLKSRKSKHGRSLHIPDRKGIIGSVPYLASRLSDSISNWILIVIYIAVAFTIACFIFLGGIESPETFSREYDASFHYNAIRSLIDSGIFSILDVRTFPEVDGSGSFYPALWHIVSAIVSNISGTEVTVAANGVIFTGLAFVFPCGIFGLLAWVFNDRKLILYLGCILPLSFTGFPWGNLIFGQIVSNFFSYAMLPGTIVLFMICLKAYAEHDNRINSTILLLFSFIGIAGTQPNSVFVAGIFCVFYAVHYCMVQINASNNFGSKGLWKSLSIIAIIVLGIIFWTLFHMVPFIAQISTYNNFITFTTSDAIVRSMFLSFSSRLYPQFVLAIICWVGFFGALFKKGKRWLCAPFLFSLFIYVVSASVDTDFRFAISGFWYNDVYRTGAMTCIFAIPLAAYGFFLIVRVFSMIFEPFVLRTRTLSVIRAIISTCVIGLFIPANFMLVIPYSTLDYENINSFTHINSYFKRWYGWDTDFIFNADQYAFLQEAEEVIAEDPGLVINLPYDGSAWMYGVEDLDVMYRSAGIPQGSPIDSELIRGELNKYATSKEVQENVEEIGAKYVLRLVPRKLDPVNPELMTTYYKSSDWKGINGVKDTTPGFEKVLESGDMRLYKIMDKEELAEQEKAKKTKKSKTTKDSQ